MTMHHEQNMKREDQQDATVRCLLLTSVSTCFRHHYAHLQENKGPVTAFGVLFWFCWMWLVAVSTCFGHHYAHLQENKGLVTCYCIWCIALVLLDVVGSGCGALSCRM
jgi:hypothetical protein